MTNHLNEKALNNQGEELDNQETLTEPSDNKLQSMIEELELKVNDLHDKLLRALAENKNMTQFHKKQLEETREYSITTFVKDLLLVMDNLSRAIDHISTIQQNTSTNSEIATMLAGVEMTKTELTNIFQKNNILPIVPTPGESFDHNLHYAVSKVESEEYTTNQIVSLVQVGYKIGSRVLRPAMVIVAQVTAV